MVTEYSLPRALLEGIRISLGTTISSQTQAHILCHLLVLRVLTFIERLHEHSNTQRHVNPIVTEMDPIREDVELHRHFVPSLETLSNGTVHSERVNRTCSRNLQNGTCIEAILTDLIDEV